MLQCGEEATELHISLWWWGHQTAYIILCWRVHQIAYITLWQYIPCWGTRNLLQSYNHKNTVYIICFHLRGHNEAVITAHHPYHYYMHTQIPVHFLLHIYNLELGRCITSPALMTISPVWIMVKGLVACLNHFPCCMGTDTRHGTDITVVFIVHTVWKD
jgi:hypothetical protein